MQRASSNPTPAARLVARSGFTLTELIVAVGAVALLTVGIGQLFNSVGKLVGTGSALAETDQLARAVGQQLRSDFNALNAMRADETFFAIRCRKLGDRNLNGALDANETVIYLNRDDREADNRDNVLPYAEGSRAVTVRLDEMMFLGFAGDQGAYSSAQLTIPAGGAASLLRPPATPATEVARIYWGHGLRPAPDTDFDLESPGSTGSNVPRRYWVADGDFGQRPRQRNRFDPTSIYNGGLVSGRNEFAGDWLLLRQTMLLYGGLAAGYEGVPGAPFDTNLNYAPHIRGFETSPEANALQRNPFYQGGADLSDDPDDATRRPYQGANLNAPEWPHPRLMRHGRVDLCAQSAEDVRRWLEGVEPTNNLPGAPPTFPTITNAQDATAFSSGFLNRSTGVMEGVPAWDPSRPLEESNPLMDAPLWQRGLDSGGRTAAYNMFALRQAIAGCFQRFQADDRPPFVNRGDTLSSSQAVQEPSRSANDPTESAYMDLHAVIGSRISNFEIAWTDGKVWNYGQDRPLDPDGNGPLRVIAERGDVIWYDLDFQRFNAPRSTTDLPGVDVSNIYGTRSESIDTAPEIAPGARNENRPIGGGWFIPAYNALNTGADPTTNGDDEYLAIFPFRTPDDRGGYSAGVYGKPIRIRVRLTVHDSQYRIEGGRQYEYQFTVNPR